MLYYPPRDGAEHVCVIDDVAYYHVGLDRIPSGCASVSVLVNDNGKVYYTRMIAGLLGCNFRAAGI